MNVLAVFRFLRPRRSSWRLVFVLYLAAMSTGCQQPLKRVPLAPISMREAVSIVNRNCDKIGGTLRAIGHVDGEFRTPEGKRTSYHLDGILFFLSPHYVRLDLKILGSRKFLLGSNAQWYWYMGDQADQSHCAAHEDFELGSSAIPLSPTQLSDLLGLVPIDVDYEQDSGTVVVQRIVDQYQQILTLKAGQGQQWFDRKEVWLDRVQPRLVRRVIFRNENGEVEVESALSKYRAIDATGPMLPHEMTAHWPQTGETMRFSVKRWQVFEELGPDAVQFATPAFCVPAGP